MKALSSQQKGNLDRSNHETSLSKAYAVLQQIELLKASRNLDPPSTSEDDENDDVVETNGAPQAWGLRHTYHTAPAKGGHRGPSQDRTGSLSIRSGGVEEQQEEEGEVEERDPYIARTPPTAEGGSSYYPLMRTTSSDEPHSPPPSYASLVAEPSRAASPPATTTAASSSSPAKEGAVRPAMSFPLSRQSAITAGASSPTNNNNSNTTDRNPPSHTGNLVQEVFHAMVDRSVETHARALAEEAQTLGGEEDDNVGKEPQEGNSGATHDEATQTPERGKQQPPPPSSALLGRVMDELVRFRESNHAKMNETMEQLSALSAQRSPPRAPVPHNNNKRQHQQQQQTPSSAHHVSNTSVSFPGPPGPPPRHTFSSGLKPSPTTPAAAAHHRDPTGVAAEAPPLSFGYPPYSTNHHAAAARENEYQPALVGLDVDTVSSELRDRIRQLEPPPPPSSKRTTPPPARRASPSSRAASPRHPLPVTIRTDADGNRSAVRRVPSALESQRLHQETVSSAARKRNDQAKASSSTPAPILVRPSEERNEAVLVWADDEPTMKKRVSSVDRSTHIKTPRAHQSSNSSLHRDPPSSSTVAPINSRGKGFPSPTRSAEPQPHHHHHHHSSKANGAPNSSSTIPLSAHTRSILLEHEHKHQRDLFVIAKERKQQQQQQQQQAKQQHSLQQSRGVPVAHVTFPSAAADVAPPMKKRKDVSRDRNKKGGAIGSDGVYEPLPNRHKLLVPPEVAALAEVLEEEEQVNRLPPHKRNSHRPTTPPPSTAAATSSLVNTPVAARGTQLSMWRPSTPAAASHPHHQEPSSYTPTSRHSNNVSAVLPQSSLNDSSLLHGVSPLSPPEKRRPLSGTQIATASSSAPKPRGTFSVTPSSSQPLGQYLTAMTSSTGLVALREELQRIDASPSFDFAARCREWALVTVLANHPLCLEQVIVPLLVAELTDKHAIQSSTSQSENSEVSHLLCAVAGLGSLARGALQPLIEMLEGPFGHPRLVALAIRSVGGDEGLRLLCGLAAKSPSRATRAAATYALGVLAKPLQGHTTIMALGLAELRGQKMFFQPLQSAVPSVAAGQQPTSADEEGEIPVQLPPFKETHLFFDLDALRRRLLRFVGSKFFASQCHQYSGSRWSQHGILEDFFEFAPYACTRIQADPSFHYALESVAAELRGVVGGGLAKPCRLLPFDYTTALAQTNTSNRTGAPPPDPDVVVSSTQQVTLTLMEVLHHDSCAMVLEQALVTIASLPLGMTDPLVEPILDYTTKLVDTQLERLQPDGSVATPLKSADRREMVGVIAAALMALGHILSGGRLPRRLVDTGTAILLHVMDRGEWKLRHASCIALGTLGGSHNSRPAAVVKILLDKLTEGVVSADTATWALSRSGEHGVACLLDLLRHSHLSPSLRISSCKSLAYISPDDGSVFDAVVLGLRRCVEDNMANTAASPLAIAALQALTKASGKTPEVELASHGRAALPGNGVYRALFRCVWSQNAEDESLPRLKPCSAAVAAEACRQLCRYGGKEGQTLVARTTVGGLSSFDRVAAATGLAAVKGECCIPIALALNDVDPDVRKAAIRTVEAVTVDGLMKNIAERVHSQQKKIKEALQDALHRADVSSPVQHSNGIIKQSIVRQWLEAITVLLAE